MNTMELVRIGIVIGEMCLAAKAIGWTWQYIVNDKIGIKIEWLDKKGKLLMTVLEIPPSQVGKFTSDWIGRELLETIVREGY